MSGTLPSNQAVTLTGVGSSPTVKAAGLLQNGSRVILTVNTAASPYDLTMTMLDQEGNQVTQQDVTNDFVYNGSHVFDSTNNYEAASIQPLSNGNFVVAVADGSAGGATSDVYLQIFGPTGMPVGTTILVDTPATNVLNRFPQVSQISNGDFVVTWYSAATVGTAAPIQEAAVYSASGTVVKSQFTVSSTNDPVGSANTHFSAASGNSFIEVSNPQNSTNYVYETYSVSNTGTVTQSGFGDIGGISESGSALEHVAGLSNGDFAVVLKDANGNSDLTILGPTGNSVLSDEQILTGAINLNVYALATGGFVVTHGGSSGAQLEGDIYNNAGTLQIANVNLTSYTGTTATYTTASGLENGLVTVARVTNGTPSIQVFGHTNDVACYCYGTLIRTERGERHVEELCIGDNVVTVYGEHRPIKWIGRRSYVGRFLTSNPGVQPIRFRAGSLGDGLPRRDLLVSPEHAMFLNGVLIPARCIVNGITINREHGLARVDYVHVELDSHDVLLAEGAPSESFLDDDSRGMFHNVHEFSLLYPDARRPTGFCAPRVEQGAALETIRRRLASIAEALAEAA